MDQSVERTTELPYVLKIKDIRRDPKAQPRTGIDRATVERYSQEMTEGAEFPPIMVFREMAEGEDVVFWLADGWHRTVAKEITGADTIHAEVKDGGLREAVLYAASANAIHGLPRTDEDKKQAVMRLLGDEEWAKWSDRAIGRQCAVSHTFVARVRKEMGKDTETRKVKRGEQEYEVKKAKPKENKKAPGDKLIDAIKEEAARGAGTAEDPEEFNLDVENFAQSLAIEDKTTIVKTVVGLCVTCHSLLPSPEAAAALLKEQGIIISPNHLVNLAKWYEGLAFSMEE